MSAYRIISIVILILLIIENSVVNTIPVLNYENDIKSKSNNLHHDKSDYGKNLEAKHLTSDRQQYQYRWKRQLDFKIDADHEEGIGTDVSGSVSVNLYKSLSGDTRLDGGARYSQHFSDFDGHGKAKIGGSLHFSHNY